MSSGEQSHLESGSQQEREPRPLRQLFESEPHANLG
jgi:hypothetical protein